MKHTIKKITISILALSILTWPVTVLAIETGIAVGGQKSFTGGYIEYIQAVFSFALKMGVALTALMLIYAGYKYITSQGNPSAINEAKDIIIGSLSGFAMLLLIYLILNVLNLKQPT